MTKHRTYTKRGLSVLVFAATIAIGACGSAGTTPSSAGNGGSADRNYTTRLRVVNEALYPETVATTTARPSRLERLNEALFPDDSAPSQPTCRRPC